MPSLNEFVIFEHDSEHVFEPDFPLKKKFSTPKIYDANGDLSKRWYVRYSFRNPETGLLERMPNIYGIANQFSTKEKRMSVLSTYVRRAEVLLSRGYNPFENNSGLIKEEGLIKVGNEVQQRIVYVPVETPSKAEEVQTEVPVAVADESKVETVSNDTKQEETTQNNTSVEEAEEVMTIAEAIDYAINLKKKLISKSTEQNYRSRSGKFVVWMEEHYPECNNIQKVTKKHVMEFLNSLLENTSARNRNNYRTDLATIFQNLEDNEIVQVNFVKKIPVLKTKPNRHQRFTEAQHQEIFDYLEEKDPHLLLYIKFVAYNFLRPLEVNRLRIGDVDLELNRLRFKAKNSPLKTKIIPELLVEEMPDLSGMNPEHFLFTPDKIGGEWDATENNRRDHFSKRFKEVVKDHFGYKENHGLYSFRHTFITKVYRELRKDKSPHAAKSDLMLITGHTSMTALEKYLRDIDAELPQDYSNLIQTS